MANLTGILYEGQNPVQLKTGQLGQTGGVYVVTGAPPTGGAGGDLAGTYPNPSLAVLGLATGPIGTAAVVPVVTIDTKGRVTGLTSQNIQIAEGAVTNLTTDLGTLTTAAATALSAANSANTNANSRLLRAGDTATGTLVLRAGTIVAGTSPIKFQSGALLTAPEVGAVEFLTDDYYATITTGTARNKFVLTSGLTSGRVPFATTNGRLTDDSSLTWATGTLTAPTVYATTTLGVGRTPTAGTILDVLQSTLAGTMAIFATGAGNTDPLTPLRIKSVLNGTNYEPILETSAALQITSTLVGTTAKFRMLPNGTTCYFQNSANGEWRFEGLNGVTSSLATFNTTNTKALGTFNSVGILTCGTGTGVGSATTRQQNYGANVQSQTGETLLRLIRNANPAQWYPGVCDFQVAAWHASSGGVPPYSQLLIKLKADANATEVGNISVLDLRDDGSIRFPTGNLATAGRIAVTDTGGLLTTDSSLTWATGILTAPSVYATTGVVVPKTSGTGIKVDTAAPTFGWADILGAVLIKSAGTNDPTWSVFQGSQRAFKFGNGMHEVWITYHVPHSYVPGTDMLIHCYWAQATVDTGGPAGVPGNVKWYFDFSYAKGYGTPGGAGDPFPADKTQSVVQQASTTQYGHQIAEVQFTNAGGDATHLDRALLEPDGIILMHIYRDSGDAADTLDQDAFLFQADIHYQDIGINGTKAANRPFYT